MLARARRSIILIVAFVMVAIGLNVMTVSSVYADEPVKTNLEITNNTVMFKAVTAYLEEQDGQTTLVMALSGDGYKELYKGTYEQAIANGDGTAEKGNGSWLHGYTNDDDKLEFRIPVEKGESYIPIVAVSNTYYTKYLNGNNSLERAFYARQVEVDADAKTLVTGDYDETTDFTVTSIKDFNVNTTAKNRMVGCPNSNNWSVSFTLIMKDATYDKVTYPTEKGGKISTDSVDLTNEAFAISMKNAPKLIAFADKTPIEMTFHVSSEAPYEEAGQDIVRNVTIDKMAKTISIEGDALHAKPFAYDGKTVQFIKKNGDTFGMWTPQTGSTFTYENEKINIHIVPKNKTVYNGMHWGGISEQLTKDVELTTDGSINLTLDTGKCGWALPIAPIKKKDAGETTSEQYFLAVPALANFTTTDADYTEVDAAITAAGAINRDIYTEAGLAKIEDAVKAVVPGKKAVEQVNVDAMAAAITAEIAKDDNKKPADYTAVEAAIATIPADLSIFTDATKEAVEKAVADVVKDKKIDKQAEVDAMAKAINDAVNALVIKSSGGSSGGGQDVTPDPAVENLNAAKTAIEAAKKDLTSKENLDAALAAIEKLTDEQKTELASEIKVINEAKAGIVAKDAITVAKEDLSNEANVDAALAAIEKLTDEQKTQMAEDITTIANAKETIVTEGTQIAASKIKSAKKSFTIKWKKTAGMTGYLISYKVGSKTKTVKASKNATKKTVKKLKSGKKYTVKVRGYREIGGKTVYTRWSDAKKVRVK